MRVYIITENRVVVEESKSAYDAEYDITSLEEKDTLEGLYKPNFYSYIITDKEYQVGETVEEEKFTLELTKEELDIIYVSLCVRACSLEENGLPTEGNKHDTLAYKIDDIRKGR